MEVTPRRQRRTGQRCTIAITSVLALALAVSAAPAGAAAPGLVFSIPPGAESGSDAGQFDNPRGVAADPGAGHVYVAGGNNQRIDQFDHEGQFVRAWGWGVADGTTAALQTCTTTCFAGLAGSGAGQFSFPLSVAVDATDDRDADPSPEGIYVGDFLNGRVQKFDGEGNFLLMFGGEVNKTTGADVCTKADLEADQTCGAGVAGEGPNEFATGAVGAYIAVGPDDTVYVGDKGRIQKFSPAGAFVGEIKLTGELAGKTVQQLAVDDEGNLYAVFEGFATAPQNNRVWKLGPAGEVLAPSTFSVEGPGAIAVDVDGNLYAVEDPFHFGSPEQEARVVKYDAAGNKLIPTKQEEKDKKYFAQLPGSVSLLGLATNYCASGERALYVTDRGGRLRSFGDPLPCFGIPPIPEPVVEAQYAISVGTESAVLRAEINPDFSSEVRYHLRYGLTDCDTGPCTEVPAPPGLPLEGSGGSAVLTAGIPLTGLEPGTTYHFQFVATAGAVTDVGDDQTFTTYRPIPDGYLPDGRAYEMVSPPQKNSGEVAQRGGISNALLQASPDGGAVSYGSNTAFGEVQGAPAISQYLSRRSDAGWSTDNITPPDQSGILENAIRAFSRDLSTTALVVREPPLCCGASTGVDNLYLRDNASGGLTLLTPGEPRLTIPRSDYCISYGGTSASGRIIFAALAALTPDAPEGNGFNLYEWSAAAGLRLVSVLPDGNAAAPSQFTGFGAGMAGCKTGRRILHNAISADGTRIFWTGGGAGLFARLDGAETIQLDLPQGGPGPAGTGQFWAATPDGSRVFFTASNKLTPGAQPNDLYLYDFDQPLGARLTNLTASPSPAEVRGVVGAAETGDSVYFVAKGVLASNEGAAVGSDGLPQKAAAGENNLYLWRQGQPLRFVATLAPAEADKAAWDVGPEFRTARVSSAGGHLAFLSLRQLTTDDNIDQDSGEAVREVYLYDAAPDELICASCNPSGARPLGPSALTAWKLPFEQARFLSDDGGRLFFESFDSLDPRDVNGLRDVYEFEREGIGDCGAASPTFSEARSACISLISTGASTSDSYFLDASASGDDVFLSTRQRLVGADEDDYYDVYDARVGGGFPDPPPPLDPCAGEACRGGNSQPGQPGSAGSAGFVGPADPRPLRCRKGQVKRKGKCVKRRKAGKRRRAAARKRAAQRKAKR